MTQKNTREFWVENANSRVVTLQVFKGAAADEKQNHTILDRFQELGGNFLDSADIYEAGESEEIIGDWMKRSVQQFSACTRLSLYCFKVM